MIEIRAKGEKKSHRLGGIRKNFEEDYVKAKRWRLSALKR